MTDDGWTVYSHDPELKQDRQLKQTVLTAADIIRYDMTLPYIGMFTPKVQQYIYQIQEQKALQRTAQQFNDILAEMRLDSTKRSCDRRDEIRERIKRKLSSKK